MTPGIWITWETQRRNQGLSNALGWPLYEIDLEIPGLFRYSISIIKTIGIILKQKPTIVVAQNPSIVLSLLVILLHKFLNYKAVIDAHNSGIFPGEGTHTLLLHITQWIQKKADLTIVTNSELKNVVESNGGKGFILPDALPVTPKKIKPYPLASEKSVCFICKFHNDEPYDEVIAAAKAIPSDIHIYITGNYRNKVSTESVPANVHLLGFISDEDYWSLLYSVSLVIDLTTRENCLVCGAYESVALLKPMLLSDTQELKTYFYKGAVYVCPQTDAIAQGIETAFSHLNKLKHGVRELNLELENKTKERILALQKTFETL